ncbi:MAG: lipoprotein insertase outer membrane protein LolB [Pseudomonadota bacterium]
MLSSLLRTAGTMLVLCTLLSSCASLDNPNTAATANPDFNLHQQAVLAQPDWQLDGRLNVRQGQQSDTVSLRWQQRNQDFDLSLSGALGLGTTRVRGNDEAGLTVEKAGEAPVTLPNLQALSRNYLSFEFPAAHLLYWVRGLPAPQLAATTTFDSNNLLITLDQRDTDGRSWQLTYDRYETVAGVPLPGRIRLTADDVQLTFLVSDWQLGAASP